MASGPDQSDELSMLDDDDGIVTPDSPQNFNGFGYVQTHILKV